MDETLIELVKKEAENLRKHATKQEKTQLCIEELLPAKTSDCIYGQMTGNCYSTRASTLIEKCCKKVYHHYLSGDDNLNLFEHANLNGKPDISASKLKARIGTWFSPIECFITIPHNQKSDNNKILIDYIKGYSDTLEFE